MVVGEVVQDALGFSEQGVGAAKAALQLAIRPGWPGGHPSSVPWRRRFDARARQLAAIASLSWR